MPPDPQGAALPGRLCGPTTLSQPDYVPEKSESAMIFFVGIKNVQSFISTSMTIFVTK